MKPVRVMVADDHPLILEGLSTALQRHGLDVVGSETRADHVLACYQKFRPDVVVLDVRFGSSMTGLDLARELVQCKVPAKVVFYSQFDQLELVREAYRLGGLGFVSKLFEPKVLVEAIELAARGETYFLPEIVKQLAMIGVRGDDSPQCKLDPREFEVFKLIANGLTIAHIAQKMDLSSRTINNISLEIKQKLGVQKAVDMARLALKHGVIES